MATGTDNIVGDIHVDTFLTNYSESFIQDASTYISNSVATIIPVELQAGSYLKMNRSYFLRDELAPRPHGGTPVQVRYGVERAAYYVDELAAEHYVDDRQRKQNALPGNSLDQNATRLLTTKALVSRDRRWAAAFFRPGVWSNDKQGIASGTPSANQFIQWNQAAANPLSDILIAKDEVAALTGKVPNTLVLGANVITRLMLSPALVELIKYTQRGVLTVDLLASMFGVERVVVARSVYNAAEETSLTPTPANPTGDTLDLQYIVDANSAWLGYVERTAAMDAPTAVAMFAWTGYEPGLVNAQGGVIRRGRDDRARSDWFQIIDATEFAAVSPDLGVFFNAAIA